MPETPEYWVVKEQVSTRKLNQEVEILRRLMRVMGWDENTFRDNRLPVAGFAVHLGVVEVAGPSGQPDYPDERYWVRESAILGTPSPWDQASLQAFADRVVKDPTTQGDLNVPALYTVTNVVELPEHSHNLKQGTPVLFYGWLDAGTGTPPQRLRRYVMAIGNAHEAGEFYGMTEVTDPDLVLVAEFLPIVDEPPV